MDYLYDLAPDGENFILEYLDPTVRERLQGAIEYLKEDPTAERGVLLRKDLTWVPFDNIVPPPTSAGLIQMGPKDFAVMAELMSADDFYGWLHSHPHWKAFPSTTDVKFHQFPGRMLIYSIRDDELAEFTTACITGIENIYNKQEQLAQEEQDNKQEKEEHGTYERILG